MTAVIEWALMNWALAMVLAVPAYVSRWLGRPAITHGLWLLVILRLIAPPMWRVDVAPAVPSFATESPRGAATAPQGEAVTNAAPEWNPPSVAVMQVITEPAISAAPPVAAAATMWDWTRIVAGIWASGSIACLLLVFIRIAQFRRVLSGAKPADAVWLTRVARLSRALGLRRPPDVTMAAGMAAPMIWAGFGRPALLIPKSLTEMWDDEQRDAVIVHELAHLKRGDHWVRWLEVVATALVWWCPLLWLARHELREAEEQLCDAWVVWVLPDARRAYATALVDAVDFLSGCRPALPPLASGLGAARNLERRIVMILRTSPSRRLTRWALALGLGAGLALVGLTPSWADDEPPPPPPPPGAPRPAAAPAEPRRDRRMDPAQQEEAAQIRQEMRRLREAMGRLEQRLAEIEGGRPAPGARAEGRGEGRGPEGGGRGGPGPGGVPGVPGVPGAPGGFGGGPGGRFGGMNPPGQFGVAPNLERRMDEMQRAIENLNRQLEEMRRMIGERRGPGRGDGPPNPPPRPPRDDG